MCKASLLFFQLFLVPVLVAAEFEVTGIRAVHHHGQTFVTWKDVAEGEAGASFRYSLYRSDETITDANLNEAELCFSGVLNHSARLFGTAFNAADRINPEKPRAVMEEGGAELPLWNGQAVRTVRRNGESYYAVVATDLTEKPVSKITPGQSATTQAIVETVAPIQPLKLYDAANRGQYARQLSITGSKGLPLRVELHASNGQGGPAGDHGDYYLYFGNESMGYRDGLPGVFSVEERREKNGNYLLLRSRDAIEHPSGKRAMETFWFGYSCVPQGATHTDQRAYPFTERRMEWVIKWVIERYGVDPQRVTAYGGSMGAWGSTTFAFRHPEMFAAVFPNRPRTQQRGLNSLLGAPKRYEHDILMFDGETSYLKRMDMMTFAASSTSDLPFYGWCCGRRDGFATWPEQIAMVRALTAARHGFAFAWNDGDHFTGSQPMALITQFYPAEAFARNLSYPAFANSSLDQNLGNGDPKDGDLEGGINLGFRWEDVRDTAEAWSLRLGNELAKGEITVDVTPRRCRQFQVKPNTEVRWSSSTGDSGKVTSDAAGLVTIPKLKLQPQGMTELTLRR